MITSLTIQSLAVQRGERLLFSGLTLEIGAGEAAVVSGPNGAGKTSLLRSVAGLLRPSAGRIGFRSADGPVAAADARRRDCHLVGHQDGLEGSRSARSELLFQTAWMGGTEESAMAAATRLGLRRLLLLDVRQLSAGQRRRLALARLIAAPRALWLLDEPFASLDTASRSDLGQAMAAHLAGGGLILAATHEPLGIAARTLEIGR